MKILKSNFQKQIVTLGRMKKIGQYQQFLAFNVFYKAHKTIFTLNLEFILYAVDDSCN